RELGPTPNRWVMMAINFSPRLSSREFGPTPSRWVMMAMNLPRLSSRGAKRRGDPSDHSNPLDCHSRQASFAMTNVCCMAGAQPFGMLGPLSWSNARCDDPVPVALSPFCHREERSDVAIHLIPALDCRSRQPSFAMTNVCCMARSEATSVELSHDKRVFISSPDRSAAPAPDREEAGAAGCSACFLEGASD